MTELTDAQRRLRDDFIGLRGYEPGLRQHIQNALRHGATREEIMEVYELTSVLGIHTCTLGVPVLLEELERAGAPA
jgi:hypothetical protein